MATEHPGLGTIEKESEKRARVFEEKAREVAQEKWQIAGRPPEGPDRFVGEAREELARALGLDEVD